MQFLSEKMCRHLSSIAPEFEGHWWWCSNTYFHHDTGENELIGTPFLVCKNQEFDKYMGVRICPAWQVEDVLQNAQKLNLPIGVGSIIIKMLYDFGTKETAYQKIEEYLWTVLK